MRVTTPTNTVHLLTMLLIAASITGCARWQYYPQRLFDHYRAVRAAHQDSHVPSQVVHRSDFKAGYIAGYKQASRGGGSSPPVLAPGKYAGVLYSGGRRQGAANHWFTGFQYGAMAADRDEVVHDRYLPISPVNPGGCLDPGTGFTCSASTPTYPMMASRPTEMVQSQEFGSISPSPTQTQIIVEEPQLQRSLPPEASQYNWDPRNPLR